MKIKYFVPSDIPITNKNRLLYAKFKEACNQLVKLGKYKNIQIAQNSIRKKVTRKFIIKTKL